MKKILLGLFCLIIFRLEASHIVGGELELRHLFGTRYELRLIYYFDVINGFAGEPNPPDPTQEDISVKIFRKSDNLAMSDAIHLAFYQSTRVSYYQPKCSNGEIKTDKLIFRKEITLPEGDFDDPQGYYVIWERCCRNYTIDNIYSENPESNPDNYAGQTFYLEFPPVVRNGKSFINSTPQLFPPLNDYACVGRLYFADFAGTDVDGDSLVYSFSDPLSTHEPVAVPALEPAPYPTVKWREGFGPNNIINGNPDLKISIDGLLTATPTQTGLFVFAVKCEEFRDGEKIGEVRRDFQMLVIDCENSTAPIIVGKAPGESGFSHRGSMAVSFARGEERCMEVKISDIDYQTQSSETIKIRAVPLNFKADVSGILPDDKEVMLTKFNTFATFELCFPECPFTSGPFKIAVIAEDDACALPLLDSLIITVDIEPPPNNKARFVDPLTDIVQTVNEWEPNAFIWPLKGIDEDNDELTFTTYYRGFDLEETAIEIEETRNIAGLFEGEVSWNPDCELYDYTERNRFPIMMLLDDIDQCNLKEPDTLWFKLTVKLPENSKPQIFIEGLTPEEQLNGVDRHVFESLNFRVSAVDEDKDELTLYTEGVFFDPGDLGVSFPTSSNPAIAPEFVSSDFAWNINCNTLDLTGGENELVFKFVVEDYQNKCRFKYRDTLMLPVTVLRPPNDPLPLVITNENPRLVFENNTITTQIGNEIKLKLKATDVSVNPQDNVRIELIDAQGNVEPVGYEFADASGLGGAETSFIWNPDCALFENGVYQNDYSFTFRTFDNRCYNIKGDTVVVDIIFSDLTQSGNEFLPPNVVTPNDDGCNDIFALEGVWSEIAQPQCPILSIPNLPIDNCAGQFAGIRIYNRWGKQVFTSTQRNFRWDPGKEAMGVYFYTILYNHLNGGQRQHEYKGSISVRD